MNITHTRNALTVAVSAAIASAAAPAMLFLGAGTCASCVGFDPQPEPPGTAPVNVGP